MLKIPFRVFSSTSRRRRLEEAYPYVILDVRYEKVREDGVIRSQAVMIAIGVDWEVRSV